MKFIKKTVEEGGYVYLLEHIETCVFDPTFFKENDKSYGYWKFDFELGNKIIDYTINTGNSYSFEKRTIRDVEFNIVKATEKDYFVDNYHIDGDIFIDIQINILDKKEGGKGYHKAQVTINQWKILSKEKKEV